MWKRILGTKRDDADHAVVAAVTDLNATVRRSSRSSTRIGIAGLALAAVGVGVGVLTYLEARSIDNEVRSLSELSPQEVVGSLSIGMGLDEVAALLEVRPSVDESLVELSELTGEPVRRVVFAPEEVPLYVTLLSNARGDTTAIAVTTRSPSIAIGFPLSNSGGYVNSGVDGAAFKTNESNLSSVLAVCLDAQRPVGAGASWGYFAVGCEGYGANNFDANALVVNFAGAAISDGLNRFDLADQLDSGAPDLDVQQITFNTIAWAEATGPWGDGRFSQLVETFEFGPQRGDPVS